MGPILSQQQCGECQESKGAGATPGIYHERQKDLERRGGQPAAIPLPELLCYNQGATHRTLAACKGRAKTLRVATPRPPLTARELSVVRRLYPAGERGELFAALPGRKWHQIADFARRHGIHRPRKSYKPTGIPVLDQIRTRCRDLNYTMPDLDRMIKGKGYFAKANWCIGHIHHRDIGRAVHALFGDIKADWK